MTVLHVDVDETDEGNATVNPDLESGQSNGLLNQTPRFRCPSKQSQIQIQRPITSLTLRFIPTKQFDK